MGSCCCCVSEGDNGVGERVELVDKEVGDPVVVASLPDVVGACVPNLIEGAAVVVAV